MLGGSGLLRRRSMKLNRREAPPTWRAFLGSVAATLVVAILGLVCGTAAPALADGSPTITTTNLPAADAGTFYTATLHATGGTGSYSWSVNPSSLPLDPRQRRPPEPRQRQQQGPRVGRHALDWLVLAGVQAGWPGHHPHQAAEPDGQRPGDHHHAPHRRPAGRRLQPAAHQER